MRSRFRKRRRSERGAVLTEYPIIVGTLALAAFAGLTALVDKAEDDYTNTGNSIGTAVTYPTTTSTSTTVAPPPTSSTTSSSTTSTTTGRETTTTTKPPRTSSTTSSSTTTSSTTSTTTTSTTIYET